MSKAFVKHLPDGTRRGNTRGLLVSAQDGWRIVTARRYRTVRVTHCPRVPNDTRPWVDAAGRRYFSRECWAVGSK